MRARICRDLLLLATVVVIAACGEKVDPRAQEGYELVVLGRMDEAIAFANGVLVDEPDNAQMRNVLALALYKQGDVEASVEQFLEALEDAPDSPDLHFNLGNAYQMLERTDDAEKHFAAAVRENGAFNVARLNLGLLYKETGRPELALEQFAEAVKNDDQFHVGHLQVGLLELQRGNFEAAIPALARVVELRPTAKEIRVHLGNAYLQSQREGAFRLAESEYRAALGIDPDYVDGLYSLGVVLAMQSRNDEAIPQFERVWQLTLDDPEDPMHKQVEAYFEEAGYTPSKAVDSSEETSASG